VPKPKTTFSSRRAEHADREQHARRDPLGQLAVDELTDAVGQLESAEDGADLTAVEMQLLAEPGTDAAMFCGRSRRRRRSPTAARRPGPAPA
jgi:hypothetical protein